jgi:SAM-dependent methyltransferase
MTPEEKAALAADGDRYHRVNYSGIGTIADPAFEQMKIIHQVSPIRSVLEVGCTTGFRLEKARQAFGAAGSGLEVSATAVAEGNVKFPEVDIRQGIAPEDLGLWTGKIFDVVVVGHLLYLLPRSALFDFAAKVDSLLSENGHLIVMDFIYHRDTVAPYTHQDSLDLYKGDPSRPWSWHPQYFLVHRDVYPRSPNLAGQIEPNQWESIDVLRKLALSQAYENVTPPDSVHTSKGERALSREP